MSHAKLLMFVKAAPGAVNELLSKFGQHGVLIEPASRDTGDFVRLKMPLDMTLSEVRTAVGNLPPALRPLALGVVPTYKGYAVRALQQHEAELMQALCPERADQLGPALGMRVNSTWVVRGIPAKATRQQIIAALDKSTPAWQGWTVIPRKRLGGTRGPTTDWIIDAVCGPPLFRTVVNDTPNLPQEVRG